MSTFKKERKINMHEITVIFDMLPLHVQKKLIEKDINLDEKDDSITIENIKTSVIPREGDYFTYISNGIMLNGEVVYTNIQVNADENEEYIFIAVQYSNDDD